MKKVILVVAMLLATNLSVSAINSNSDKINNVKAYDINVNINSLARYLGVSKDQYELIDSIQNSFSDGLRRAAMMDTDDGRKRMVNNAIEYNTKNMSYILTNEQYKKYLKVFNQTINNRGLLK
jgi:hypothetical protein